jgi:hypothetical protein
MGSFLSIGLDGRRSVIETPTSPATMRPEFWLLDNLLPGQTPVRKVAANK